MEMLAKIISLGLVSQIAALGDESGTVVTTNTGQYRGMPPDENGVVKFLGIPFAKPPIGSLRFKPTEVISPHTDVFDATKETPVCPQLKMDLGEKLEALWGDYEQNEDCLYLDVYVPSSDIPSISKSPRAVMVWIHGGGNIIGFKNNYQASILAGLNDVVVVTINYRLGVLGFMTTLDENAVGNIGLMDQIVALQWVEQNIAGFGGDKNRVTIAGESAGAISVTQLAISPASKGLIHRVIAQSGSPVSRFNQVEDPLRHVIPMAKSLDCPTNDNRELVECLQKVPVEELLEFQEVDFTTLGAKWGPVYNNDFFPFTFEELKTKWENLATREQLLHTDLMIGVNSEEGAMFYSNMERVLLAQNVIAEGQGITEEQLNGYIVPTASFILSEAGETLPALLPLISYKYTDWTEPEGEYSHTKMFVQYSGDTVFNVGAVEFARIHATIAESFNDIGRGSPAGRTYLYQFDQTAKWMPSTPWRTGADHGDDIFFMFGFAFWDRFNATEEEVLLSRQMMKYWTNFMKTGDPNEPIAEDLPLPTWPPFNPDDEEYIVLNKDLSSNSVKNRLLSDRVAFWLDLIPKQMDALKKTCSKPDDLESVCHKYNSEP